MAIHVTGKHVHLSPDQMADAQAEAEKLSKFFNGIMDIKITFDREGDNLKAEIVCNVSGHGTLVAHESGRTVNEALDLVSEKMARQLREYKDRLHERRSPKGVQEPEPEPE